MYFYFHNCDFSILEKMKQRCTFKKILNWVAVEVAEHLAICFTALIYLTVDEGSTSPTLKFINSYLLGKLTVLDQWKKT